MSKSIMGNGGFYGCLIEPQGVSAWWKETAQTRVFVHDGPLLGKNLPDAMLRSRDDAD